jgi:hypothetical protein
MYQVRKACGQPGAMQNACEKRVYVKAVDKKRELETMLYVSEWIYKRDKSMYSLTI